VSIIVDVAVSKLWWLFEAREYC